MKNKINSRYKSIYIPILCVLALFGCTDDIEDINTDPLAATEIPAALLYPQFFLQMSSNRTIELNGVNIQSQHWASAGSAGVFSNPERYVISPFTIGNNFTGIYTGVLRNLDLARSLTLESNPDDLNTLGQIKTFEAFAFLHITQIYGDAPLSEAIRVDEFPNPVFDAQEDMLRAIADKCDEAVALLETETGIVTDADLIYDGNRTNWIRFANSLKLKTLMLIANVDPGSVQSEIQELVDNPLLILENSQNAYLTYPGTVNQANPIWQTLDLFAVPGTNPFWYAGSTLVNIMNDNDDPRRSTYFSDADDEVDGIQYVGQDQGVFDPTGISTVSLDIIRPELEDRFFTAAETNFFIAEAILKGFASGDAQAFYEAGLRASLDSYDGQPGELSSDEKEDYVASRGSIAGLSNEDAIERVNIEQYVALFTRGLEAWTHWRRTKTPEFQLPDNAQLSDIIRRYGYPTDELTTNENSPAASPDLIEPMWFENQ